MCLAYGPSTVRSLALSRWRFTSRNRESSVSLQLLSSCVDGVGDSLGLIEIPFTNFVMEAIDQIVVLSHLKLVHLYGSE